MAEDRELVERLAAIDATPRTGWVAELRADLDAAWETDDSGHLGSRPTTMVPLVDNEAAPSQPSRGRGWAGLIVAAVAVIFVAGVLVVVDHDDPPPADQPAPPITVPPVSTPRALFGTPDEEFEPGTYFVDEVDGTPTAHISITIGTGWTNLDDGTGLDKHGPGRRSPLTLEDDIGFIEFSRPDKVYLDACHLQKGFYPGPVTTLDSLVDALGGQVGWADVTVASDISVSGYRGKTFQRTAPAVLSDCPNSSPGHMRIPKADAGSLRSWQNESASNLGGWYYEPGQVETLVVLDIDGTIVVISSNLWPGSSASDRADFADVLSSIRVDPRPLLNVPGKSLEPGTYYVDDVNGTPTSRIFATLDAGWWDVEVRDLWFIAKGGAPGEGGIGLMTVTNPVAVFSDACHPTDGFHPGPIATVDEFVTALREQHGGWADMTDPADISVDGYMGKVFERTAPAEMSGCTTREGATRPTNDALFPSWETPDGINGGYEPGQIETLWVLDIGATVVVISTELWPGPSASTHADFADSVLDSIRIDQP